MRIYTEVTFEWNDKQGKLVEVSSESFDYNGEMALCGGWSDQQHYTDASGNRWSWRVQAKSWGAGVSKIQYYKNGEWFSTDDNHYDSHRDANTEATRVLKANANSLNPGSADSYFGHSDEAATGETAWKAWYKETTNLDATDDFTTNAGVVDRATSGEYAWVEEEWQNIKELTESTEWELQRLPWGDVWTRVIDDGETDTTEFDYTKLPAEETRAATLIALGDKIKQWENITTPGQMDDVENIVKGYISTLKEKEEGVKTAFEDIFGAEGEEEGTIFDIEDIWETAKERGKEKYTTDIGTAVTEREEGLEDTVVGREGELGALREEAGGEIRAAEAKIGAAGFASTGVGQTARDVLAEEIGETARDIDVGFTEERSDVKQSYLTKTDPLEKEFGEGGTAYEDYITTRDISAKGALAPWKTATEAYEAEKKRYEELYLPGAIDPIGGLATEALGDIGASMMELITTQIAGSDLIEADPDFDPFAAGGILGAYDQSQFGLMGDSYFFTGVPELDYESFYTPYTVDPDLQKYDPETPLPWEEGYGG